MKRKNFLNRKNYDVERSRITGKKNPPLVAEDSMF